MSIGIKFQVILFFLENIKCDDQMKLQDSPNSVEVEKDYRVSRFGRVVRIPERLDLRKLTVVEFQHGETERGEYVTDSFLHSFRSDSEKPN